MRVFNFVRSWTMSSFLGDIRLHASLRLEQLSSLIHHPPHFAPIPFGPPTLHCADAFEARLRCIPACAMLHPSLERDPKSTTTTTAPIFSNNGWCNHNTRKASPSQRVREILAPSKSPRRRGHRGHRAPGRLAAVAVQLDAHAPHAHPAVQGLQPVVCAAVGRSDCALMMMMRRPQRVHERQPSNNTNHFSVRKGGGVETRGIVPQERRLTAHDAGVAVRPPRIREKELAGAVGRVGTRSQLWKGDRSGEVKGLLGKNALRAAFCRPSRARPNLP